MSKAHNPVPEQRNWIWKFQVLQSLEINWTVTTCIIHFECGKFGIQPNPSFSLSLSFSLLMIKWNIIQLRYTFHSDDLRTYLFTLFARHKNSLTEWPRKRIISFDCRRRPRRPDAFSFRFLLRSIDNRSRIFVIIESRFENRGKRVTKKKCLNQACERLTVFALTHHKDSIPDSWSRSSAAVYAQIHGL